MLYIFTLLKNLICLKNFYIVFKIILVLFLRLTCLYFKGILKYTVELFSIMFISFSCNCLDQNYNNKYILDDVPIEVQELFRKLIVIPIFYERYIFKLLYVLLGHNIVDVSTRRNLRVICPFM